VATPLGITAVAVGFAAQGLAPSPYGAAQGELLDALMAVPPPINAAAQMETLRQLRAERLPSANPEPGLTVPAAAAGVDLEIRVALLGVGDAPNLKATGPWQVLSRDGRLLQQGSADVPVDLSLALQHQGEAWLQTAGAALLVNGSPYGGKLRVLMDGGRLQVVNHLPLEVYVSSVVGAEMPSSWSMEALRAQAVAARSYALAHMARPANRHWHLGDTTRWQAYRGLASIAERTRQATSSTAGLILSYQGAIVESLYAANHQITLEAHGHLGASMSQHGAQEMALQGLRYNQILGRYYPGASLARLRTGAS